jgi:RNA polymerase sigma-70 factor (ECF subfamily)
LKQTIDNALAKLSEIQRNVLLLRDYEGYNYEQIGEITGLSESQVKVYIYRARIAMKDYLVSLENVI